MSTRMEVESTLLRWKDWDRRALAFVAVAAAIGSFFAAKAFAATGGWQALAFLILCLHLLLDRAASVFFYPRPGLEAAAKLQTDLLRSCRLAFTAAFCVYGFAKTELSWFLAAAGAMLGGVALSQFQIWRQIQSAAAAKR